MDLLRPSYASGYAKNASQSAHPNLWDGLVGAWMPSLGVTGETLRDVSGNGNHGTLTNMDAASDWVATSKGLALDFDGTAGSTDHIVTQTIEHGVSNGDFTWSIWFYPTTSRPGGSTINGICAIGAYSPVFGWSPGSFTNQLGYYWNGWKGFGVYPSLNSWNHGVMTRKNGVITGYLDGKIGSASYLKTSAMNNDRLVIGRSGVSYAPDPFGGRLTNFIFHNRALSPQEIKQLYVDSLAPFRTKKRTVVRVPSAIPAATVVGSIKKPKTIIKPSYQAGYARNASESENPKLWDGLIGAWMPSLGVTGETLRDVSRNGNHGTLTGMDAATDWVATNKGLALEFDGSDDRVLAGDLETLDNMSIQFTVRVNSNPGSFRGFLGAVGYTGQDYDSGFNLDMGSASTTAFETLSFEGGIRRVSFGTNLMVSSVDFGVWCNMCLVVSSSEITLFLNGVKESSATRLNNSTSTIGMNDFVIGKRPYSGVNTCVEADFANVSVYNRTLSPSEIKHLYVDSLAPFRKKQRVSVAVPAAVPTPSATYHPLRSLAHPLEQ